MLDRAENFQKAFERLEDEDPGYIKSVGEDDSDDDDGVSELGRGGASKLGPPTMDDWDKIPISTMASKSAFSTAGRVLDPFRSSLSSLMVEALICTQNWLRYSAPINIRTLMDDVEEFEKIDTVALLDKKFTTVDAQILKALDMNILDWVVRKPLEVVWLRPLVGWWKLNVDGSCCGNPGNCGGGGVLRDHRGRMKVGFSAHYGFGTNNEAELGALLQGVQLCKAMDCRNIILECDSKALPEVSIPFRPPKCVEGEFFVQFTKEELDRSAVPFRFSMVLEFLRQRPSLDRIRGFIHSRWGLTKQPVVSAMRKARNVFVRFSDEDDFLKSLSHESCDIEGVAYRPFQWSTDFTEDDEPSLAPVWIMLPGLPPNLYQEAFLRNIVAPIGIYLRRDNATRCATRTDGARVCVLMNIDHELIHSIWIGTPRHPTSIFQEIEYETLPAFCSVCKVQGHNVKTCKANKKEGKSSKTLQVIKSRKVWVPKDKEDEAKTTGHSEKTTESPVLALEDAEIEVPVLDGGKDAGKSKLGSDSVIEEMEAPEQRLIYGETSGTLQAEELVFLPIINQELSAGVGGHLGPSREEFIEPIPVVDVVVQIDDAVVGGQLESRRLEFIEPSLVAEDAVQLEPSIDVVSSGNIPVAEGEVQIDTVEQMESKSEDEEPFRDDSQLNYWKKFLEFDECLSNANQDDRRPLWSNLLGVNSLQFPHVIIGDFNVICNDNERRGGNPRMLIAMEDFCSFIDDGRLVELPFSGNGFSWCNGRLGMARSWARLDRALCNSKFKDLYPSGRIQYLPRRTSDHSPMVEVNGTGLWKLAAKLKRLKLVLKSWNKEVFGWTGKHIKELEAKVEEGELRLQECYSEDVEADVLANKVELDVWLQREESRIAQQVKQKWVSQGEVSTAFFKALQNNKHNMVVEMKLSDGRVLNSPEDIHEAACGYFEDFLKAKATSSVPDLVGLISEEVSEEENNFFGSIPSVGEVKDALFSIPVDSSPGPDGFGSGFFQHCWSLVYQDLLEAVSDFFGGAVLPSHILKAFGFSPKVCQLLAQCVTTPWYSVVMNGVAKGFFKGGRGLRQGDPLSPYLFILVEEVLSRSSVSEIIEVLRIYAEWSGQQFTEGVFPVKYLGVPIVSSRLKLIHFQDVIQKIRKKIEGWK
ncbi:hypothetical protein F2P56_019680, partial [Juglans regia]